MNKAESLKSLLEWGFNVPPFKIINPGRYFTELPVQDSDFFGIRTCLPSGKGFSLPFLRNVSRVDVPDHVDRLARQGYVVILYPWYPKEWSEYSMHVQMSTETSGMIEYLEGPSIVRDLMRSHKYNYLEFNSFDNLFSPFVEVVRECSDIYHFYGGPCIIELSIMDREVGTEKRNIVFWEIRDA